MKHCIFDSMDSSENSTKQLECRLILTRSSSLVCALSHADSPLCSGVHCRLPLFVSRRQLPSSSFVRLSSRVPLPLPVTPRSPVQNPLSGFAPKQTKESSAWRATYIVLLCHFLPVHHLEWHFGPGRRSKYNTTTWASGPGSNDNEEVLRIHQSSSITGTSPSDCLVS